MKKLTNVIQSIILASLSFLVTTVLFDAVEVYKYNKEWNTSMDKYSNRDPSPIVRGPKVDTLKIDTIK